MRCPIMPAEEPERNGPRVLLPPPSPGPEAHSLAGGASSSPDVPNTRLSRHEDIVTTIVT